MLTTAKTLAVMLILSLAACDNPQPPSRKIAAGEVETTYRDNGEIEGCRLYHVRPRFGDNFQLAVCDHATATTAESYSCGKACRRMREVTTQ